MLWSTDSSQTVGLKAGNRNRNELRSDELEIAQNSYIMYNQKESYPQEYRALKNGKPLLANSRLLKLNIKLDSERIIRCDTRLKHAKYLQHSTKFLVVLPPKHGVTKLIVKHCHELSGHYSTNQTLAALLSKYWTISGREEIRELERECTGCKLLQAQTSTQIMAPLPSARTEITLRVIAYYSVDFGGPFLTKQSRGKPKQKRCLCLFTCMCSRAVHLEMATGVGTDFLLNALYRMTCRRGIPVERYTDNDTNFVGADRELKELYKQMDKDMIVSKAANKVLN